MKLIIIGCQSHSNPSIELAYARSQMQRKLPRDVSRTDVTATTQESLIEATVRACDDASLADDDTILVLRNGFLSWIPGTLDRLADALRSGASAALAYDSTRSNPLRPPGYLTIRGLERYEDTLIGLEPTPWIPDQTVIPALLHTTAGNLRHGTWNRAAALVPGAYAHDFSTYHQARREDVIPLIPRSTQRILDVGGGEGGFLEALKHETACETHLSEHSEAVCEIARKRVDMVWQGDFLDTDFGNVQFDCISFLEVLEHAAWPDRWLQKAVSLLQPGGHVVASIPNVGHWSVVADLLEGRWDYAATGIHCITHLRFFTRHSIENLFAEAGLKIIEIRGNRIDPPEWFCPAIAPPLRMDAESLATYTFLIVAKPEK